MDDWVADYVRSCGPCQESKSPHHALCIFFQLLELAYSPWSSISIDYITDLPEINGFTSIWVIVDRFTKMAHFILLKKPATAENLAKVFVREIW